MKLYSLFDLLLTLLGYLIWLKVFDFDLNFLDFKLNWILDMPFLLYKLFWIFLMPFWNWMHLILISSDFIYFQCISDLYKQISSFLMLLSQLHFNSSFSMPDTFSVLIQFNLTRCSAYWLLFPSLFNNKFSFQMYFFFSNLWIYLYKYFWIWFHKSYIKNVYWFL